uniref:Uncharacterized protein n=1 Tax=Oryza sativa subsp. japonica TaxID=39947 RepID=Q69XT3_ORYSJ|nr:hypothetical protein [Oryza sativa Japonica Group]
MVIASAVGRVWTESTKGGPHSSAVQGAAGHRGPSPRRRSDGRGWPGGIASEEGNRASKAAARQAAERRAGSREGCSPSTNDEKGGARKLSCERPRRRSTRKTGSEAPTTTGGRGGASEHLQDLLKRWKTTTERSPRRGGAAEPKVEAKSPGVVPTASNERLEMAMAKVARGRGLSGARVVEWSIAYNPK